MCGRSKCNFKRGMDPMCITKMNHKQNPDKFICKIVVMYVWSTHKLTTLSAS